MGDYTAIKISKEARQLYSEVNGVFLVWQWLIDNYGLPGQQPSGYRWQWNTHETFYFRNEKDAVLFSLTWGSIQI